MEYNKDVHFKQWFEKTFPIEKRYYYKDEYYKHLVRIDKLRLFSEWFIETYINDEFNKLNVLEEHYKSWATINGKRINALYPPGETIKLTTVSDYTEAAALIKVLPEPKEEVIKELQKVIKQNNYTNVYVQVLGQQLTRIESAIEILINKLNQVAQLETPLLKKEERTNYVPIKPPPEVTGFKLHSQKDEITSLIEQLKKANLNTIEGNSSDQEIDEELDEPEESISDISNEDNLDLNQIIDIEDSFKESMKPTEINKLNFKPRRRADKYYYKRPTPMDILFEENDDLVQNSYHGNSIYEWSIDGASEKVIHDQLHRMMMYATVCKQNNNSDRDIANFITCGFTGF